MFPNYIFEGTSYICLNTEQKMHSENNILLHYLPHTIKHRKKNCLERNQDVLENNAFINVFVRLLPQVIKY